MDNNSFRVVVADDESMNLEILVKAITNAGYIAVAFEDGDTALEYVQKNPENVDIIILDKIMPNMSGMEVLRHIKSNPALKNIPIILQTGDVGVTQLKEGLEAGAYYYLSKPFYPETLISLVNAAARDCVTRNRVLNKITKEKPLTAMLKYGVFEIRTIEEAYQMAAAFAYHANKPTEVNLVISNLIINAIEHGNLKIGYETKNQLLANNGLDAEISRRAALPENVHKFVKVTFDKSFNKISVLIEDQGEGFDWKKYMKYEPIRLTDLNGRGIASANLMNLGVEYIGSGNKVKCQFYMPA